MGSFLFDADNNLKVNVVVGASSGGLTDTELRATPVPVSGTLAVTGPLTDTQLRATPVPVSGTFWQTTQPVSGSLTNTELRADPVPIGFGTTALILLENILNEMKTLRLMVANAVCETGEVRETDFFDVQNDINR